jgi:hypothetical protein
MCFYSIKKKKIKFDDVTAISKKNTVFLIPNAIEITAENTKV